MLYFYGYANLPDSLRLISPSGEEAGHSGGGVLFPPNCARQRAYGISVFSCGLQRLLRFLPGVRILIRIWSPGLLSGGRVPGAFPAKLRSGIASDNAR
jgi:hypothetical protein